MTTLRPWILVALVGLALPVRCLAFADMLIVRLNGVFEPIIARVGPDLTSLLSVGPVQCELWHRGVETTPDKKVLGPTSRGFVFRARRVGDLATFKPKQNPFDWDGYPKQAEHPWVSEFHLFPTGGDTWLCVSIWRGPDADQQLIRELLEATSKSVEEQRRGWQH